MSHIAWSVRRRVDGGPRRGRLPEPAPVLALLVSLLIVFSSPVAAQQGAVGGIVVHEQTGRPLVGAQVVVDGTGRGTLTDGQGRFLLPGVPGTTATLRVQMIGYRTLSQEVRVGDANLRIALVETPIALDEVIVTGTPGGTQRRAIGNAVGRVRAEDVLTVAPPPDVQQMLSARVPGVRIMKSSGEIGTGGTTRIRGAGSLALSSEPLVFIDGVRIDNTAAAAGSAFRGISAASRINDINPEDIESIEVIKGPAAATLYGTEASNGVIQIITKRGQSGRPAFDFTVKQGANYLPNPERVFPDVWGRDPATGELVSLNIIANDIATGHGSPFSTGHVQEYGVSVSGGSEAIRYYLSTDYDSSEGIVSYNWQNRLNTRANLTYNAGDQLQLDFNLGMLRQQGRSASTVQPITTHIVWGSPGQLNTRFRGYLAQVPEAYHDVVGIEQVDRSIGNVRITHTPFGWLSHRLTVGGDFGNSRSHGYWPRHPDGAQGPFGTNSLGRKQVTNLRNSFITTDYSATATVEPRPGITFATSAGAQYYQRQTQIDQSLGLIFPVPGVETVSGAASRFADEDFLENKTFGLFLQEQIGLGNRLFLTAAIRGDDNSAFGENYEFVMYPKLSASYVISEEPFFEGVPLLNTLKLRGAWGRAGQQPDVFAAIRVYQPTTGPGGVPTLTPQNIGNPDLRPEVGEELEFGFDASLLNDRLALEFTYYNQTTRDAIVPRSVLPSIGFPGVQFVNLGEINNQGIELGLNANVLQLPHYNWDLGFTFSTNRNVVRSLGGVTMPSNALGQRHMEGFPLGSIFLQKVVQAEFDADGRVMNMLCEGGDPVTGGGPAVPCSEAGTAYWGQPLPRWEGSVYSNLTLFRNFTLHALVDFVGGFQRVNGDLAASHIFFRNSRTINEGSDPILAAYDRRNQIWQTGIHDGGFAKLRNVSGTYTLPSTWAQRLGASRGSVTLSADNLRTLWIAEDNTFGHRITDPEIRSNNDGLNAYNQEKWPQFTRVLATFRLSY